MGNISTIPAGEVITPDSYANALENLYRRSASGDVPGRSGSEFANHDLVDVGSGRALWWTLYSAGMAAATRLDTRFPDDLRVLPPQLLAQLEPVDIVLLEGWKTGSYPKLEVWRAISGEKPPRFPTDPTVIAVASEPWFDTAQYGCPNLPAFRLNDLDGITAFVLNFVRADKSTT